jgi:hypothetical protein
MAAWLSVNILTLLFIGTAKREIRIATNSARVDDGQYYFKLVAIDALMAGK